MVWAAQGDIVQGYVINPNPMFDMSPSRDKTYCGDILEVPKSPDLIQIGLAKATTGGEP